MSCFRSPKKLLPSKKACKRFVSTLNTHLPESLHKIHHRLRPIFRRNTSNSRAIRHLRRPHQNATTIYATPAVSVTRHVETGASTASNSGGGGGRKGVGGGKWKEYLESLPPIRGVDERAEEFITNFRQQIKIQREQSLLDFQEMLARSA